MLFGKTTAIISCLDGWTELLDTMLTMVKFSTPNTQKKEGKLKVLNKYSVYAKIC